jgi:hypothetical protein
VGKGTVYYFATPLTAESWHHFFDALYDTLGVTRLTRTLNADGENFFGIDSRTVAVEGGYLTYVINLLRDAREVTLLLPAGVSRVTNLSAEEAVTVPRDGRLALSLGRFETVLLKLTGRGG